KLYESNHFTDARPSDLCFACNCPGSGPIDRSDKAHRGCQEGRQTDGLCFVQRVGCQSVESGLREKIPVRQYAVREQRQIFTRGEVRARSSHRHLSRRHLSIQRFSHHEFSRERTVGPILLSRTRSLHRSAPGQGWLLERDVSQCVDDGLQHSHVEARGTGQLSGPAIAEMERQDGFCAQPHGVVFRDVADDGRGKRTQVHGSLEQAKYSGANRLITDESAHAGRRVSVAGLAVPHWGGGVKKTRRAHRLGPPRSLVCLPHRHSRDCKKFSPSSGATLCRLHSVCRGTNVYETPEPHSGSKGCLTEPATPDGGP